MTRGTWPKSAQSVVLAALCAASASAKEPASRVALVIDKADSAERGLFETLAKAYRGRAKLSLYEFDDVLIADPIAKGRLLADLETRDLVVAVGDGATELAAGELESVPVYFVDAAIVKGRRLASPSVSGVFSYNVEDLLDALKALRLDVVGLVFTPGYEPVAELIRGGAASRGFEVFERRISSPKEVAPTIRSLLDRARAIWLVGDPLLMSGAGFEFIQERSLSLHVPLVVPGKRGVERGALLGYQSDLEGEAIAAERAIDLLLRRRRGETARLSQAPGGGLVLLNETLARKWGFGPAGRLRWRMLR